LAKRARQRIEGYLGRLYGYAFCLTEDREQSHDLVQECALKALVAGRVPCDEPAYRAWLFKILRNLHIDRIRRSGNTANALDEEPPLETWQVWRCDDSLITAITVKLGLAKLTPAQREIIAAIDIAGLSYREAAEMAYYGSKVLHPQAMIPAVTADIPVVIRNTFAPDRPGTRITARPARSSHGVKTVTSVPELALITVEGNGMIGVPGVMRRVFSTTATAGVTTTDVVAGGTPMAVATMLVEPASRARMRPGGPSKSATAGLVDENDTWAV